MRAREPALVEPPSIPCHHGAGPLVGGVDQPGSVPGPHLVLLFARERLATLLFVIVRAAPRICQCSMCRCTLALCDSPPKRPDAAARAWPLRRAWSRAGDCGANGSCRRAASRSREARLTVTSPPSWAPCAPWALEALLDRALSRQRDLVVGMIAALDREHARELPRGRRRRRGRAGWGDGLAPRAPGADRGETRRPPPRTRWPRPLRPLQLLVGPTPADVVEGGGHLGHSRKSHT